MQIGLEGQLRIERFDSPALRRNPLGDPSERAIPVYVPPGYGSGSDRYPVVYWLPGYTGTGLSALNAGAWTPGLPGVAEEVIAGGAPPFLLVVADGFTRYGGSQYLNSSAVGQYEASVAGDLVAFIDARFRTLAGRSHRGIVGHSSGGYGALVLGMRHPDVYSAVAAHSPDAYFEYCYKPDFPKLLRQLDRFGSLEAFLEAFRKSPKKEGDMVGALSIVAMAMAYSPNPNSPHGFDLPFDTETGELGQDVWRRWEAEDPVFLVDRHAEELRQLKLLYFECGIRDEYNLLYGARILHRRLLALSVEHEYREFDDTHGGISYRYRESLDRLARALA